MKFFDGADAQEMLDFAKILPDEYMDVKKVLVQVAFKKNRQPEKKDPVYLDIENFCDPCDV